MKKEKLRFIQVLIKTGIIQIISVILSLYLPSFAAFLLNFILCILLGMWIFGGCDEPLVFCCFIATLMGTIPFIAMRIIFLSIIPETLAEFREWVNALTMAMAIPMMGSMYFAVVMTKFEPLDTAS